MKLKYVAAKQVFGFDESKTEKYVARQVISGQISFSKLCTQVGRHRVTVQLVIAGLVDALINNLDDSKSVQLGEFGTFRSGIRAKAASAVEDVSAENIYRRCIIFAQEAALKEVMNKVSITHFATPDTDYTKSAPDNSGGSDYGEAPDPFA